MSDTTIEIAISKTDDEQQIVFGEVYAPNKLDSHDDYMSPETIRQMAYEFIRKGFVNKIDTQHNRVENGSYVVESFIARDDDPTFIPGSWVLGVHVPDPSVWAMVKSGEINGFSLDGFGVRVQKEITLIIPDVLKGETDEAGDPPHKHEFIAYYDEEGNFIGGMTNVGPDGMAHAIHKGTVTEDANGHNHRFSYIEGVILVEGNAEGD